MTRKISREEFEKLPAKRQSRWAGLLETLESSYDPHPVTIPRKEQTADGRSLIQRQLRSLAHSRGWKIRVRTISGSMFVQRLEVEG